MRLFCKGVFNVKQFTTICCVLFLLAGCIGETQKPGAGTPVTVYVPGGPNEHSTLEEITAFCPEGGSVPLFALEEALRGGGRPPFPDGTAVSGFSVDGSTASVALSEGAAPLTGFALTLARACVVLTLTGLDGIESVELTIGGQEAVTLRASDFVTGALVLAGTERTIALYFTDETGRQPVRDTRTLVVRETDTVNWYLRYMLEELIAGPQKEGLYPILPEGTRLLSVSMEGGVCSVNFSAEFVSGAESGRVSPAQTLYCLVRSVTAQTGVTSLRLLVEGILLENYGDIDTSEPLVAGDFSR
jgi:germination protein M